MNDESEWTWKEASEASYRLLTFTIRLDALKEHENCQSG
jgi:hypothetical protein